MERNDLFETETGFAAYAKITTTLSGRFATDAWFNKGIKMTGSVLRK